MNLYEILGLNKDATSNQIKSVYRKLAQQHHPDHNGDRLKFEQIKKAYEILSDPERRSKYDRDGVVEDQKPDNIMAMASEAILNHLNNILSNYNDYLNVIQIVKERLDQDQDALRMSHNKFVSEIKVGRKVLRNLKRKSDKYPVVIETWLNQKIHVGIQSLKQIEAAKKANKLALEILCQYEYTVKKQAVESAAYGVSFAQINQNYYQTSGWNPFSWGGGK